MTKLPDPHDLLSAFRNGVPLPGTGGDDRLNDLDDFGANPGNLRARIYVPGRLPAAPALVVVLHGCTQTAAGYDRGSGWSELADQHGFVLLFPEQSRENNPNLCFGWFLPEDARAESGEAKSIRSMIAAMVSRHRVDPTRIFITGLSAGGAMTAVMLAAYPDIFAGGAIIAGLPSGCTSGVPQALARMRGEGLPDAAALDRLLRRASAHGGPWPTVSVWHGSADRTVDPANAEAIIAQWRGVHGLGEAPDAVQTVDGHRRRVWRDASGREAMEAYTITGLGHGTPLATKGDDACGAAGPHMLEAGISSTRRIAAFWGLIGSEAPRAEKPAETRAAPKPNVPALRILRPSPEQPPRKTRASGVGKVIEDALRAAGLMR